METFSALLSSSFSWYRKIFPKLLPFLFLFFLIQASLVVLEFLSQSTRDFRTFAFVLSLLIALTFIRWVVFSFLFPIVVLVLLKRILANESVSFFSVFKRMLFYFFPYLVVSTILVFVLIGGLVLFLLPALLLLMYLAMTGVSVVAEDRHGFGALERSWGLVRGSWRQVFSYFIVLGFLLMVFLVILNIPAVLLSSWVGNITIPKELPLAYYAPGLITLLRVVDAVYALWGNIIELILIPFPIVFSYVLFQSLKTKKGDVVAKEKRSALQALLVLGLLAVVFYLVVVKNITLFSVWANLLSGS